MSKKQPKAPPSGPYEKDEFRQREIVHRAIDALVLGRAPAGDGMRGLFALVEATAPSRLWVPLNKIEWGKSIAAAAGAVGKILAAERLAKTCRGLFFTMPEVGQGPEVGLAAYTECQAESGAISLGDMLEWPKDKDPVVTVEGLTAVGQAFDSLYPDDDAADAALEAGEIVPLFAAALGVTCFLAVEVATHWAKQSGARGSLGFAAGPAGGEEHFLGRVERGRWTPRPSCWLASASDEDPEQERDEG